ncbi:MAG: hypothetical protein GTN89_04820 [Acidobacteria bacterium]|nr:hypothetical protein [Acidobacteriota bacterium]NIM60676.1 hypothetical protein [Acidobacteriota bacterium]NIO58636.1 hypothetical protein [Acidobacteriota bacterium]NIQ29692.1 hypothetical protein [Acidobacteriota bacterium]NIQ84409.1 hypothetical protein [Acidobacteriota bacterium]
MTSRRAIAAGLAVFIGMSIPLAAASWVGLVVSPGASAYAESADSISTGLQPHVEVQRIDLEPESNRGAVLQLLGNQPRAIVAVGAHAVREIRETGTDIPLIYAMVLNPAALDLPEPGDRDITRTTGVSMSISLDAQFSAMREMLPQGRTLGVLYNPQNSGALIESAREVAERYEFELLAQVVRNEGEVPTAARLLLARVDGMWGVADPTVLTYSNARMLLLQCLRSRRPFFAVSEGYVRTGALAAVAADPEAVGRRAAQMALHVAEGGSVREVPPEEPPGVEVFINRSTAGRLGLETPQAVLGRAPREVGR